MSSPSISHLNLFKLVIAASAAAMIFVVQPAYSQTKPATEATKKANAALLQELDFANQQDFENAKRGLIAPLAQDEIKT